MNLKKFEDMEVSLEGLKKIHTNLTGIMWTVEKSCDEFLFVNTLRPTIEQALLDIAKTINELDFALRSKI